MKTVRVMIAAVLYLMIFACGKSSSSSTPSGPTAEELCDSGWTAYEATEYGEALSYFTDAMEVDEEYDEAYTGRGWAYLRSELLSQAKIDFQTVTAGATETDYRALIGLGSIYVTENQGTSVVTLLSPHVNIPNTWSHDHDTDVLAIDLHNLLAEGYIMTGVEGDEATSGVNAPDAWGQVKKSLSLDPTDVKALEIQAYLRGE